MMHTYFVKDMYLGEEPVYLCKFRVKSPYTEGRPVRLPVLFIGESYAKIRLVKNYIQFN